MATSSSAIPFAPAPVAHRRVDVDGLRVAYRDAGPVDGPLVLLPHGYPCSSFQFRGLMAALGDRWRTIAPDYPGFGYSATPDPASFDGTFDAHAEFLQRFVESVGLDDYVVYLHDYGSQLGLRLAMAAPERVRGLIVQNGDIYEDQHGPKYEPLKEAWARPLDERRRMVAEHVNEDGFRDEFIGELHADVADRVAPDLWALHWALMDTPERRELVVRLLADQPSTLSWFARQQAYLRQHRPPTLIVWGPEDGYMPEGAATAYLRDLPHAELQLLDGAGHWALETHLAEIVALVRDFLDRVHPAAPT